MEKIVRIKRNHKEKLVTGIDNLQVVNLTLGCLKAMVLQDYIENINSSYEVYIVNFDILEKDEILHSYELSLNSIKNYEELKEKLEIIIKSVFKERAEILKDKWNK